jgi:sec-independent protein translocase protein TatA
MPAQRPPFNRRANLSLVIINDILQPTHLLFVLVIALLVLGPKRLPEVGRSLGRGLRDFKGALNGEGQDHAPEEVMTESTAESKPPAHEPAEHSG